MDFKDLFRGFLFGRTNSNLPQAQDETSREDGTTEIFRNDPQDFRVFGHSQEPSFVFGDMFSMMGEMFREMESSIRDMDEFFGNNFEEEFFQHRPQPPSIMEKSLNDERPEIKENIRDYILKRDVPKLKPRVEELVDNDLDDLTNDSSFDVNQYLPKSPESNDVDLNTRRAPEMTPRRNNGFNFSYNFSQYTYKDGKMVEGKSVKRTPDGEEVTTFIQNEDGQIKSQTEYQPSDAIASITPIRPENRNEGGMDDQLPYGLFERFFRPRI